MQKAETNQSKLPLVLFIVDDQNIEFHFNTCMELENLVKSRTRVLNNWSKDKRSALDLSDKEVVWFVLELESRTHIGFKVYTITVNMSDG